MTVAKKPSKMQPVMEPRSLQFITHACQGTLLQGNPDTHALGVSTDSRKVQLGDLFVALRGDHFDGHEFLQHAARNDAAALLVSHLHDPTGLGECGVIQVDDTRSALGRLAAAYRNDFSEVCMVAVAGSNGKTTTKNLLAAILEQKGPALFSPASYNNDIGVPLSLLRLRKEHEAAVLEAGTNHAGELAPLIRMMRPQHGILTGIGPEHLEFFGTLEGVAEEEGWVAELLPVDGCLFVHGDSPWLETVLKRCQARVVRVGMDECNDWRAKEITLNRAGTRFEVSCPVPGYNGPYHMRHIGRHLVSNALLALAVGAELGVSSDAARAGLAVCPPSPMRMEYTDHHGVGIINDAYNANVPSMQAALQTCRELPCRGRRIAVLGDMAELGEHGESAHREIGRLAAMAGLQCLVTVGRWAEVTATAAREAGLGEVRAFAEADPAADHVLATLRAGDLVLFKASRAARLERIVSRLKDRLG